MLSGDCEKKRGLFFSAICSDLMDSVFPYTRKTLGIPRIEIPILPLITMNPFSKYLEFIKSLAMGYDAMNIIIPQRDVVVAMGTGV